MKLVLPRFKNSWNNNSLNAECMLMDKNIIFEYLVFRLDQWKNDLENAGVKVPAFTKLRLQKILFLVCAWNVEMKKRKLLNVFDHFCALPYGPVEVDIYEAMKSNNAFLHISFDGNKCVYDKLDPSMFSSVNKEYKEWVDEAVERFMNDERQYLTMPVFDLVDITHRWTAWKITMEIASFLGNKKESMTVESICKSPIKAY